MIYYAGVDFRPTNSQKVFDQQTHRRNSLSDTTPLSTSFTRCIASGGNVGMLGAAYKHKVCWYYNIHIHTYIYRKGAMALG